MSDSKTKPVLLIHGGAWAMPDDAVAAHERGIAAALSAGWAALQRGGTSVDAVEAAVTVMEDDDTFDAGRGSFLTRDGRVQLDALLMNGENLRTGGVACVERLKNPIQAARLVLDKSPHVYFVGPGAERFATQNGMRLVDNTELIVPRETFSATTPPAAPTPPSAATPNSRRPPPRWKKPPSKLTSSAACPKISASKTPRSIPTTRWVPLRSTSTATWPPLPRPAERFRKRRGA
jgi:hypothetical protein